MSSSSRTLLFTRSLGNAVADATNLCTAEVTPGYAFGVTVNITESGARRDRVYVVDVKKSANPQGWRRVVPSDKTEEGTTWGLDVLVESNVATFRLVRTQASVAATSLKCKVKGSASPGTEVVITGSSTTASGHVTQGVYEGALLVQVGGNVGIGTDVPETTLDVKGSARISGNLTLQNLLKKTTGNALYVDVSTGKLSFGEKGVDQANVYTKTQLDEGQLDGRYYTEMEVDGFLGGKENVFPQSTTATYFRGDKTFQTLDTNAVPESTNLYFTNARAQSAVVSQTISANITTTCPSENAVFDALALKENTIAASTTATYYRGDKTFQTLNTTAVPEGSNLYFTDARAQAALVTQLNVKANVANAQLTGTTTTSQLTSNTITVSGNLSAGNINAASSLSASTLAVSGSATIGGNTSLQNLVQNATGNALYVDTATGLVTRGPGFSLLSTSTVASTNIADPWVSRTSAADNQWYSVTWGNGLFVAVSISGSGNRVMTSPDGITWTSRQSAADNQWASVTWGNGLFVAISVNGTGMTSPDGISWTSRTTAANEWRGVTWGNGLFVAVSSTGTGNRVMTSSDGITWTLRNSAVDNYWISVTWGNGLFVAVSVTGSGNRVMTSPDGITWTSRTSAADNNWLSVTWGNGLFVAVAASGTGNRVMTSPDGITWTIRESAADNQWYSVTYGDGLFVAVSIDGAGNRVMTSPDGITWTIRQSAADNQWWSVTYGDGLFVAVSLTGIGNRVMTWDYQTSTSISVELQVAGFNVSFSNPVSAPAFLSTGNVQAGNVSTSAVSATTMSANTLNILGNVLAGNLSTNTISATTVSVSSLTVQGNTLATLLSAKENVITASTTATYFRGDKTFQTLNTTAVPEGSNLYFTDARAQAALVPQLAAKADIHNPTFTGTLSVPNINSTGNVFFQDLTQNNAATAVVTFDSSTKQLYWGQISSLFQSPTGTYYTLASASSSSSMSTSWITIRESNTLSPGTYLLTYYVRLNSSAWPSSTSYSSAYISLRVLYGNDVQTDQQITCSSLAASSYAADNDSKEETRLYIASLNQSSNIQFQNQYSITGTGSASLSLERILIIRLS